MNLRGMILSSLIHNKEFNQKVLPYLKSEYFANSSNDQKPIFDAIITYQHKYHKIPNKAALAVELTNNSTQNKAAFEFLTKLEPIDVDQDWLIDHSEKFCKERALHIALHKAIEIESGEDTKLTVDAIPDIIREALAVTFDQHVGHDFHRDFAKRYEYYHDEKVRLPFKQSILNTMTNGGVLTKTLNIILGGTNGFKSGTMCDFAAWYMSQGIDVLYITLEMHEEMIAERIEANLMQERINDIHTFSKPQYFKEIERISEKTKGRLIIKQFPTGGAGVAHFRALLSELSLRENFRPKVIFVDYLTICMSSRIKSDNMYVIGKAIAEELRGLAIEYDVPIWTGGQLNRGGTNSTDPALGDVAESHGISQTADLMLALFATQEMDEQGIIVVKQLKNRFGSKDVNRKIVLGVDKARMTLFELENKNDFKKYIESPSIKRQEEEIDAQVDVKNENLFVVTNVNEKSTGWKF